MNPGPVSRDRKRRNSEADECVSASRLMPRHSPGTLQTGDRYNQRSPGSVQDDLKPFNCRRRDKVLRYLIELSVGRFERMLARRVSSPEPSLANHIADVEIVKPMSHARAVKQFAPHARLLMVLKGKSRITDVPADRSAWT